MFLAVAASISIATCHLAFPGSVHAPTDQTIQIILPTDSTCFLAMSQADGSTTDVSPYQTFHIRGQASTSPYHKADLITDGWIDPEEVEEVFEELEVNDFLNELMLGPF